jgi:hypothetical protein
MQGPGCCHSACDGLPCHDGLVTDRDPRNVAFEPVQVDRARRHTEPVIVIAAALLVVGLAITKPWGSGEGQTADDGSGQARPTTTASPRATTAAAAATDATRTERAAEPPSIPWSVIESVIRPHDRFGVRAIVRDRRPGPVPDTETSVPSVADRLVERWAKLELLPGDASSGTDPVWFAMPPTADQGVLALGLSLPDDAVPLDIRFMRRTERGWAWLRSDPIAGARAAGMLLYAPPTEDGVRLATWPAGSYRIEILEDVTTIRHVEVDLPDRFEVVPGPTRGPSLGTTADRRPVIDASYPGTLVIATRNGTIQSPLILGPRFDAASAWVATRFDALPSFERHDVDGLGYLFPPGTTEHTARLTPLLPMDATRRTPIAIEERDATGATVEALLFMADGGDVWPPALYRLDVAWRDDSGPKDASIHLELRP